MSFLDQLAAQRRFGMRPGLEAIRRVCAALGDPQLRLGRVIHVAGTNGKGAVCAMLDSCLRAAAAGRVGRYTSPHLVKLNERFFLDGAPVGDATLERLSERVADAGPLTFFEALTAVAFLAYAEARTDYAILETGLGGRLDATNVCAPALSVITRVGLDHCDWLGDTVEKIAAEKGGIVKPGVPVLLAKNVPSVRTVIERIAAERGSPFLYAPDLSSEEEIPPDFSLSGAFNRENAVTVLSALKVLFGEGRKSAPPAIRRALPGFGRVAWPGRFQRIGRFLVDGAHNPPAARALAEALAALGVKPKSLALVAGFCGDKDVGCVLSVLAPLVKRGYAVRTNNSRSLSADETVAKMRAAGIDAVACASLREALAETAGGGRSSDLPSTLVCGSLFLAGEALVELGAYPWGGVRFDGSETLKAEKPQSEISTDPCMVRSEYGIMCEISKGKKKK